MPKKTLAFLSEQELEEYDYNRLIGLVRETNRPPGGAQTVSIIAQNAFIGPRTKVLEIGTSTGFTAIELALDTQAKIVAIDVNEESLGEARKRAREFGVDGRITFRRDDALNLSSADSSFDVVICGNVTSLLSDAERALREYIRVLKTGGVLAAVPMYYLIKPPLELVRAVSHAIGVNITPKSKIDWVRFFSADELHLVYSEDFAFDKLPPKRVDEFVRGILKRQHLSRLQPRTAKVLSRRYAEYMQLFRRNVALMGFTIMLMRKTPNWLDRELFTCRRK